jgi:hypothetical protein
MRFMPQRRLILALPLLPLAARAQPGFLDTDAALALLRAGGLNLYLRHAITDRAQMDTGRRGDRAGQRNLSAAGRAQAAALGAAFRRLAVPVAEVLSSEVFRARDTAELAFGTFRIERDLIADDYTPAAPWRMRRRCRAGWRSRWRAATGCWWATSCRSAWCSGGGWRRRNSRGRDGRLPAGRRFLALPRLRGGGQLIEAP